MVFELGNQMWKSIMTELTIFHRKCILEGPELEKNPLKFKTSNEFSMDIKYLIYRLFVDLYVLVSFSNRVTRREKRTRLQKG